MKFRIALCALALAGCTTGPSVQASAASLEQALIVAERAALVYVSLPQCNGSTPLCSDPAIKQKIKDADNIAYAAVKAAEGGANAATALAAITAFQKLIPGAKP